MVFKSFSIFPKKCLILYYLNFTRERYHFFVFSAIGFHVYKLIENAIVKHQDAFIGGNVYHYDLKGSFDNNPRLLL